jgi:uncharacterized protein (DUF169 family)
MKKLDAQKVDTSSNDNDKDEAKHQSKYGFHCTLSFCDALQTHRQGCPFCVQRGGCGCDTGMLICGGKNRSETSTKSFIFSPLICGCGGAA